jgi:hypothetical protein
MLRPVITSLAVPTEAATAARPVTEPLPDTWAKVRTDESDVSTLPRKSSTVALSVHVVAETILTEHPLKTI